MVGIIYSPGRDWVKWSVKILGGWGSCPPPPPAPSVLTALQSFLALMMVNLLEFGEWELLLTLNRLKTIRFDLNCKDQQSTKTCCDNWIYFVVVSSVISVWQSRAAVVPNLSPTGTKCTHQLIYISLYIMLYMAIIENNYSLWWRCINWVTVFKFLVY
jgi:hypothetical protein